MPAPERARTKHCAAEAPLRIWGVNPSPPYFHEPRAPASLRALYDAYDRSLWQSAKALSSWDALILRKNTILVVDDRDDDLMLLKRMFRNAGLLNEVQTVSTVSDARSYLQGKGTYSDREKFPFPILMLLDMHLPDGSGVDVLNWLRDKGAPSPAAVVVLTGSDIGSIRQSYALGAHSFLTKPLKFEDFQNMVAHVRGIKLTSTSTGRHLEAE